MRAWGVKSHLPEAEFCRTSLHKGEQFASEPGLLPAWPRRNIPDQGMVRRLGERERGVQRAVGDADFLRTRHSGPVGRHGLGHTADHWLPGGVGNPGQLRKARNIVRAGEAQWPP
jgi:hypothetical protein